MSFKWLSKKKPKEPLYDEQGLPIIRQEKVKDKKTNLVSKTLHSFFKNETTKKNPYLLAICIIIIGGYFFFLTSGYLFPGKSNFTQTELFTPIQFSTDTIKLMRWEYSPDDKTMELEIDSAQQAFIDMNNFNLTAKMGTAFDKKNMPVDIAFSNPDFIVLQIKNVPKDFGQINVMLSTKSKENNAAVTTTFYTNQDKVTTVQGFDGQYLIKRQYAIIADYENQIQKLSDDNGKENEDINVINTKITKLEEDKKYQTIEQMKQTEQTITSYKGQIQTIQSKIKENDKQITELHERIDKANELIEIYKNK